MYQGYDETSGQYKKSTKGVPTRNFFSMDLFKSVLLDETTPKQTVEIRSLRLNNNKEMSRMTVVKSSLSDIFVKMRVDSDKILCKPLISDGKIL